MTNLIIMTIIIAAVAGIAGMLLVLLIHALCPKKHQRKGIYDYQYCSWDQELDETIVTINKLGGKLISVTLRDGVYTVFFWRPADG